MIHSSCFAYRSSQSRQDLGGSDAGTYPRKSPRPNRVAQELCSASFCVALVELHSRAWCLGRVPGTGKHRRYPETTRSQPPQLRCRACTVFTQQRTPSVSTADLRHFLTVVRRGPLVFLSRLRDKDVSKATACNPALNSTSRPSALRFWSGWSRAL